VGLSACLPRAHQRWGFSSQDGSWLCCVAADSDLPTAL
jgi:hypothetical protein